MFIEDMPDGYRVHVERNIENQWSVRITEIKVTDFIENKCGFTDKAKVRYIDTNRVGQVN
ncbi:hypothetical protein [Paenibacillus sp. FSL K6-0108]|uniref:hypothetical protein n=1 Tax=Paenibacillus sp. FSL K6-0108 TaxID=2921417 RepID=UPI003247DEDC